MGLNFPDAAGDYAAFRPGGDIPTFIKYPAATLNGWYRHRGAARRFNYLTNAAMKINQAGAGSSGQAASHVGFYTSDQWIARWNLTGGGVIAASPAGGQQWPYACNLTYYSPSVAQPVLGASDYALFHHKIEGSRMADLQWGTSNAKSALLRFWWASPPGTYVVKLTNHDWTRCFYKTFTVSGTGWREYVIPIPPPAAEAAGPWKWDTGIGLQIEWVAAAGSALLDTSGNREGAWLNGNVYGPQGATINAFAALGTNCHMCAPGLYADDSWTGVAPPFEHQPYEEALADCLRYWQKIYSLRGVSINATSCRLQGQPFVPMRVAPAITLAGTVSAYDGAIRAITGFNNNVGNELYFHLSLVVATGLTGGRACAQLWDSVNNFFIADARM